ncbi:MAG: hypothetical protein DCC88_03510 [Spirobacillus cienkowskii]|jgi:hypothetical protein|uniref:Uncharacterized protein n=1 Tax=Spirobacillus cienkowskii TaxID=495820 RepID=A0A369KPZ9_9BACT|nr:MAG: hypothetical protein DCC88_03510 [Spirobacillus cienkowskii]
MKKYFCHKSCKVTNSTNTQQLKNQLREMTTILNDTKLKLINEQLYFALGEKILKISQLLTTPAQDSITLKKHPTEIQSTHIYN